MENKKKTLTISSSLKKKIDTSSISRDGKKSFEVDKKKTFNSAQRKKIIQTSLKKLKNVPIMQSLWELKFMQGMVWTTKLLKFFQKLKKLRNLI